ncbi:MAG: Dam family site-specific DNA-(adenine-N6)-methyltransferase [Verrucomicrobiota bacterium]
MPPKPAHPPLTPPLKWAGGKRWLVPQLRQLHDLVQPPRLVEPFCGGLSVALGLQPSQALLNDLNPHLINFYQQLRSGLTPSLKYRYQENLFYHYRDRFNQLIDNQKSQTPEAAELFYYLNRSGFNGLCRFNRSGHFNVPFGRYSNINYRQDWSPFQNLLKTWQFTCQDFATLPLQPTDFIYADPPYDVEFTQYSPTPFSWEDQVRLVNSLANHPGPVILSNQLTDRIHDLYQNAGYQLYPLNAPRRISCTGDRSPAREVLAIRNLDPEYTNRCGLRKHAQSSTSTRRLSD